MVSPSRCPPWQPERPRPTRREPRRAQRSYTTRRDTIRDRPPQPGIVQLLALAHMPEHRRCPQDEQLAEIALPHPGDPAEPLLAGRRVLPRCQPGPGREVAPAAEALHRRRKGMQRQRTDRADAGIVIGRFMSSRARVRERISFSRPAICSLECGNLLERRFGHRHDLFGKRPFHFRQLKPHRRDARHAPGPRSRRIPQAGPEVNRSSACAGGQAVRGCGTTLHPPGPPPLHCHEPHGRAPCRLDDRGRVVTVILLPFQGWLDIDRRDRLVRVAKSDDLSTPVMRATAGLHHNQARKTDFPMRSRGTHPPAFSVTGESFQVAAFCSACSRTTLPLSWRSHSLPFHYYPG